MKFLVFTTDVIPLPGFPTSGTALRTYGFIQGLRSHGHEVIVSVPSGALSNFRKAVDIHSLEASTQKEVEQLESNAFHSHNQGKILADTNPEIVFCGHWPAMTPSLKPSQILVVDLAGPHLLERHYQSSPDQKAAILGKLAVLANADFFVVSGPSQRLYFLSFLLRAGVEHPESRIVTIPMPLDPCMPEPLPEMVRDDAYPRFVFGGVFLPWQNPMDGLRTVSNELLKRERGRLMLIGGPHPHYEIKSGLYEGLFKELEKNPRVITRPMLPLQAFIEELTRADIALDLMQWNLERQLAVTIRSTTYLWAGLPIIYNDYADLSALVRAYDAGWCISPDNRTDLVRTIETIIQDPEQVQQKASNARRLAQEVFSWDKAVKPLLDLLQTPAKEKLWEVDIILDCPEKADLFVMMEHRIQQYFICRLDGLTRLECRIATHEKQIVKPVTFRLYHLTRNGHYHLSLIHQQPKKLVVEKVALEEDLRNNEWFALDTKPIPASAGEMFLLEIEAQQSIYAESISPWAIRTSPYPMLELHYGDTCLTHMALCMRTTCSAQRA